MRRVPRRREVHIAQPGGQPRRVDRGRPRAPEAVCGTAAVDVARGAPGDGHPSAGAGTGCGAAGRDRAVRPAGPRACAQRGRGRNDVAGAVMKRRRAPLDASGGRPTTTHELQLACGIVDRSGVVPVLEPYFTAEVGRHRLISLRGLLVACQLNALARHHKAHLIEVARVVNAMTDEQRDRLGIARHDPAQTYDRVDRTFTKLTAVLDAGQDGVDAKWCANRMAQAAVPEEFRQSRSIAVDGTDVETWGALHGDAVTVELDGEATETQLMDTDAVPKPKKPARKAKVFGTGADGRNIYTADADARAGHRSATNSRAAGPYVGYELHLAVQARDVKWTNYIDKVTMSD